MERDGEKCGDATAAYSLDQEASLDLAEELFVSCRFTEAARVCTDALSASPASGRGSRGSDLSGSNLVVVFEDQIIAPVGECSTCDLIVAVLLQCGFELQRAEEWHTCRDFYGASGTIPFAVAILWLRLRLGGGEFELVRRVLWQLREALGDELLHLATTTTTDKYLGPAHANRGAAVASPALANYSEATEMLVVQIMLPCGEFSEASSLVSDDAHLGTEGKSRLLKACEQSAIRAAQEERDSGAGAGAGVAATRTPEAPDADNCRSRLDRRRARGAPSGRPEIGGNARSTDFESEPDDSREAQHSQQGPVQKFFSDVSDWTPEARIQVAIGAGAAGLAIYAAFRNRGSLGRAARSAASLAARTAGEIGAFVVGAS